jgi:predicted Zn-dependent peptidase
MSITSPPRFEHSELPNGVRLATNRNQKLKTILVKAFFTADLDDDVTRRALVPMILRRGTRSLPDMQKLSRRRDELFACSVYSSLSKVAEWQVVRFSLDVVNESFLTGEDGVLQGGLELMRDLIYDPVLENDAFLPDYVEQEKENLRLTIESLIDEKGRYAAVRCVEEMCRDEPYRLSENGRIEDLPELEPVELARFHREWSSRAPLSIYVAGDIDPALAAERVADVFGGARGERLELAPLPGPVDVKEVRVVEEKLDVKQGKLVLGFRHDIRTGDPADEALVMMNIVLGGGGNSQAKLFQNVREKESMAYSAYSSVNRLKGLASISCGIEIEKYDKALNLCLEQLEAIRRGEISDNELDCARETILESNRMLEDDFSLLAEYDFARGLCGQSLDLEGFRQRIRAVTRDDIVAASARLQHDTTYFLRN